MTFPFQWAHHVLLCRWTSFSLIASPERDTRAVAHVSLRNDDRLDSVMSLTLPSENFDKMILWKRDAGVFSASRIQQCPSPVLLAPSSVIFFIDNGTILRMLRLLRLLWFLLPTSEIISCNTLAE